MQDLPFDFYLPDFNVAGKKKLVGNGVPLSIDRVLAKEVARLFISDQSHLDHNGQAQFLLQGRSHKNSFDEARLKKCGCGCGRKLVRRKKYYDPFCRKRAQRVRDKITAPSAT
ncbi:hypothetical protein [uncultured Gammaproteobacteria bacterium]|uniref:hypothetical protein n=1 Tax=Bathymodiolus heckerae thiotrophic gill symbiont TaxID=1052212 RepID=UPI0010FD99EF|nr:hypothetical protein [Bathymodiolus heckerae thiotrophic gill symbiont]CAC9435151.1 hypothetical protein [uncultured Gammaproteobacteria bacterium]CAC9442231.1 hypothetical protein [uncultured Gammaproteobacteria bacterium]